jgi:hypothetical protein
MEAMSTVRLRPTFRLPLATDRETAIETIRGRLTADERFAGRWRGKGRWAEIYVPHKQRRLWSPHLSLRLDREGKDGCSLFGRFAPHPEVWTFFMFLYIGLAFGAVFGAVLGYVQWASNEAAWGLWALAIGLPAIGLIHLAGALGQRLGQSQMRALKEELDEIVDGLTDVAPDAADARPT